MRLSWTIGTEDAGVELKNYLMKQKGLSRRLLKAIKKDGGQILVNGAASRLRCLLEAGDCVEFLLPAETKGPAIAAEQIPLTIVYEDEAIIVLDKPAGMAVIPSPNHPNGTLANALLAHYEAQRLNSTVHIVTRLDRDTSGLVLVAKNRYVHALLSEFQKAGQVERSYTALAEGVFIKTSSSIDLPIGRKEDSIIERIVTPDGQNAVTHYKVKQSGDGLALLSVRLETGRTHQIRVHLAHEGHPLAGDSLYGGSLALIKRQALHCERLFFMHPYRQEKVEFISEPPEDMMCLIREMN